MQSPLITAFEKHASADPEKAAVDVNGDIMTYGRLYELAGSWAARLAREGIGPGSRVGLWLGSRMEFWTALFSLWRLNAAPVILNDSLPKENLRAIIAGLNLDLILIHPDMPLPEGASRTLPAPSLEEAGSEAVEAASPDAEDLAIVLLTSGTTGINKAVELSHRSIGGNALATAKRLGIGSQDRWFFNIAYSYTSAIAHTLTTLASGGTALAYSSFIFPQAIAGTLASLEATGFGASPIQVRWLVESLESSERPPLLKRVMSSGDALPPHVIQRFMEVLPGCELFNVYGMTELGGRFCMMDPSRLEELPGSVGRPIDGLNCRILLENSNTEAAPGQVGEVYAGGDYVMNGYYKLPEQTAKMMTAKGLRSGDLGHLNGEGFLFLVGRTDDVFKSSGEKVSRIAIEQALLATGQFHDVAVIGVKDEYLGVVPKVFYSPKHDGFDKKTALGALREKLPESHIPHSFEQLDEIPRTGSGKLVRARLPEQGEAE